VHLHILYGNIPDCDSCLSVAFFYPRIKHAAWSTSIGLLLLLCTDVDTPPERISHLNPIIYNVFYQSVSVGARVRLNIHGLVRVVECNISEGNISNAVMLCVRRHCPYSHTYAIVNENIFDSDILSALSIFIALMSWLDSDSIIVACYSDIPDDNIGTRWIYSVCVQWICRHVTKYLLTQLFLLIHIYLNCEVL
jgi:hypothetical protein